MRIWRAMLRFACGFAVFISCGVGALAGQQIVEPGSDGHDTGSSTAPVVSVTAPAFVHPVFVGSYCPNGRFLDAAKLRRQSADCGNHESQQQLGLAEVPPWIDLHDRNVTTIEDRPSSKVLRKTLPGHSRPAFFLESFVAFAYGRRSVMHAPIHVTTDSQGRLIVSDPSEPAVLILSGGNAIRIQGGPGHRLRHPDGIAVDKDDDIYVVDGAAGMIQVYAPNGTFLRALGMFRGEPIFEQPTAIAIDQKAGHLYVLDTPPGELIKMDLEGHILARAGGHRNLRGVHLEFPSEIALRDSAVVVLDLFGTRVSVVDLDCKPVHAFSIRSLTTTRLQEMGLAIDSAGAIYVSDGAEGIRSFRPNGQMIGTFGAIEGRPTDFTAPLGMWIDPTDHIYVADTYKSRVQVFHHPPGTTPDASSGRRPIAGASGFTQ